MKLSLCINLAIFAIISIESGKAKSPPKYSSCYSCNSNTDGDNCNEESAFGEETNCADIIPDPKNGTFLGCIISLTTGGETSRLERTCIEVTSLEEFKCRNSTEEDITEWSCICQGDLCNKNFDTAKPPPPPQYSKCYSCDSNTEGVNCNEESEFGIETNCVDIIPYPKGPLGCIISLTTGGETSNLVRTCTEVTSLDEFQCSNSTVGDKTVWSCKCQGDLCNKNFDTAKPTPPPQYTNCYSCDSNIDAATCNEESQFGEETNCVDLIPNPKGPLGCLISLTAGGETSHLVRTCAEVNSLDEFKCSNILEGDKTVTSCRCQGDLCNKNFDTAHPDSSTTSKPTPSWDKKCYSCTTDDPAPCDEYDNTGPEVDCNTVIPDARGYVGCRISKTTTEDGLFDISRTCSEVQELDEFSCFTETTEGATTHSCECQNDLCNQNWETAGDDTNPTTTTSRTPSKRYKCYTCNSNTGDCDEYDAVGKEDDCVDQIPEDGGLMGCRISKVVAGGTTVVDRSCAQVFHPEDFKCSTSNTGHSCTCQGDLCNENWDTAAGGDGTRHLPSALVLMVTAYICFISIFNF